MEGRSQKFLDKHIRVQYTLLELSPSTILASNARHQVLVRSSPIMFFHRDIGTSTKADKSAMGAINRPLRLAGVFCQSALLER
jgi:hypothetical protein